MPISEEIQAIVPQVRLLETDNATLTGENAALQTQLAAAQATVQSLAELQMLAQNYMDAPNGQDAEEQAALVAFLAAHPVI